MNVKGTNKPSRYMERDKRVVAGLKADLRNGTSFTKHDAEYIEAAYEQLGRGVPLSRVQSYIVKTIRKLEE